MSSPPRSRGPNRQAARCRGLHRRRRGHPRGHDRLPAHRLARGAGPAHPAGRCGRGCGRRRGPPEALATHPAVLLTTGGTGPSPTDATPDATAPLLDRPLPGVAEAIRARAGTPTAALGRGLAGIAGGTMIVNLPGSPAASTTGCRCSRTCSPTCSSSCAAAPTTPTAPTSRRRTTRSGDDRPRRLARVTDAVLDAAEIEAAVLGDEDGALVTFRGVIRDHDGGRGVAGLDYSAHPEAERFLAEVCERIAAAPACPSQPRTASGRSASATWRSWPRSPRLTGRRRSPPAATSSTRSRPRSPSGSGSTSRRVTRSGSGSRPRAAPR